MPTMEDPPAAASQNDSETDIGAALLQLFKYLDALDVPPDWSHSARYAHLSDVAANWWRANVAGGARLGRLLMHSFGQWEQRRKPQPAGAPRGMPLEDDPADTQELDHLLHAAMTPLMLAARDRHLPRGMLEELPKPMLHERLNDRASPMHGWDALDWACASGAVRVADQLVCAGLPVTDERLGLAAAYNRVRTCAHLRALGANAAADDSAALLTAVRDGDGDNEGAIAELLRDASVDPCCRHQAPVREAARHAARGKPGPLLALCQRAEARKVVLDALSQSRAGMRFLTDFAAAHPQEALPENFLVALQHADARVLHALHSALGTKPPKRAPAASSRAAASPKAPSDAPPQATGKRKRGPGRPPGNTWDKSIEEFVALFVAPTNGLGGQTASSGAVHDAYNRFRSKHAPEWHDFEEDRNGFRRALRPHVGPAVQSGRKWFYNFQLRTDNQALARRTTPVVFV